MQLYEGTAQRVEFRKEHEMCSQSEDVICLPWPQSSCTIVKTPDATFSCAIFTVVSAELFTRTLLMSSSVDYVRNTLVFGQFPYPLPLLEEGTTGCSKRERNQGLQLKWKFFSWKQTLDCHSFHQ